jgi:hypothetical protein
MKAEGIRTVLHTSEFDAFYNALDERVKNKFDEYFAFLESVRILSTKIVKKPVSTERLYELCISVGYNEYRSVIFSVNHDNIIQATEIILLNGFLKKSSKDYDKQIKKSINILKNIKL